MSQDLWTWQRIPDANGKLFLEDDMGTAITEAPLMNKQHLGGKYLTFALGKEEYGLEILKVREIIGWLDITALPRTPPYVKGVINLRGQVIVVIDLRTKFAMEAAAKTDQTCIIVVEITHSGRKLSTGIIVDRVSEVLEIPAAAIEDAPTFGTAVDTDFILGMGKVGEAVKILLDIDKVMTGAEIAGIGAPVM
jgi:purine-binding chemotaxis protein CheW